MEITSSILSSFSGSLDKLAYKWMADRLTLNSVGRFAKKIAPEFKKRSYDVAKNLVGGAETTAFIGGGAVVAGSVMSPDTRQSTSNFGW